MLLTFLAIIPAVALLIFIYLLDRKEKEPIKLLLGCLLFGILSIIPAVILETVEGKIFGLFVQEGSVIGAILDGFIVAGLSEELFKLLLLRLKTWNSKHFDCMFDGIVYSVFVSLGFAVFENVMYVLEGGITVAFMRMLTALPGHTSFAVYMGFFYSKAKLAKVKGNTKDYKKYSILSLVVPVIVHGLYDSLIMLDDEIVGDITITLSVLAWLFFVVVLFIFTFIFVIIAEKNDDYILMPPTGVPQIVSKAIVGSWTCSNNHQCSKNFCAYCGEARPVVPEWTCKGCGETAYYKFCPKCGTAREQVD